MSFIIEGYACRFGERDLNDDIVMAGAFSESLRRHGTQGVRMLYQHQARTPVGVWDSITEDATGLLVRGAIFDAEPESRMVASLVKSGAVDGLSIGFRTVKSRRSGSLRVLTEVDLWEISIVTFPMLPSARVTRLITEKECAL